MRALRLALTSLPIPGKVKAPTFFVCATATEASSSCRDVVRELGLGHQFCCHVFLLVK
jgi:hypothetical protein